MVVAACYKKYTQVLGFIVTSGAVRDDARHGKNYEGDGDDDDDDDDDGDIAPAAWV